MIAQGSGPDTSNALALHFFKSRTQRPDGVARKAGQTELRKIKTRCGKCRYNKL
jgi:hypothetical protein